MTAADRANAIQLINYWEAMADGSHDLSRRDGIAQFCAGFSAGMAAGRRECSEQLAKFLESGEFEPCFDEASLVGSNLCLETVPPTNAEGGYSV